MARLIRSALLVCALAYVAAGNPLPPYQVNPWPEYTSYCTSTTFITLQPKATPTPPSVVTRVRHTAAKVDHVAVDCGGCAHLEVAKRVVDFDHPYPGQQGPTSVVVVTAAEPTSYTRLYCSGFFQPPPGESDRRRDLGGMDEVMDFVEFDDDAGVLFQGDEDENCTARVFQVPKINLGPTRTIFTTTTTASRIVNCGTCTNASPIPIPLGVPPVAIFKTTVTATEPFTATELVCGTTTDVLSQVPKQSATTLAPTKASPQSVAAAITTTAATLSQASLQNIVASTDIPSGTFMPDCVLSYALQAERLDSTSTVYTSTVTRTIHRACGPCALVWWTAPHEPTVTTFVKTVTKKEPKTETVLACSDD